MRTRGIKPAFFKNDALAELPAIARILFIGLWCMADRAGRLEDRPKKIHAEVMPFDGEDVNGLLDLLAHGRDPFIIRYEYDGAKYIQIVNFAKHQHCHVNEPQSTLPAPPNKHGASTVRARYKHDTRTVQGPNENGANTSIIHNLDTDYCNPITDNCNPESGAGTGHVSFDDFWKAYPRKTDKADALKAFSKLAATGTDMGSVEAAAKAYAAHCRREETPEKYIKHGSTFLRDGRWMEWVPAPEPEVVVRPDRSPTEVVALPGEELVDPEKARAILNEYIAVSLSK